MESNYTHSNLILIYLCLLGLPLSLKGQTPVHQWEVDATKIISKIQPTMYGIFYEDINFAADGGLYAEMIKNRSFEFTDPKLGWSQPKSSPYFMNPNSGMGTIINRSEQAANRNYLRIHIQADTGYVLINEGFRGMGVKEGQSYHLSFQAAQLEGAVTHAQFELINEKGEGLGHTRVKLNNKAWQVYETDIKANQTEAKAKLKITFTGNGKVGLDMVSLFPVDTWKNRKKGLRKDLVQLLAGLQPGFLRFPGGCIVEGRTLARRYQWKKTVGSIDERASLINRWNTEFDHRPTPDYYQSFGLGFYEYFQLAEDLGATPMPIVSCGMACQFNTAELVPLAELDPYVQDALDLIEFANGDTSSTWGRLRSEMGHPASFNMKYIGIGNEQWGEEYIQRYKIFAEAIKAQYPDIVIVSTSGPFPEWDYFEYAWKELSHLQAEIIDEHYYQQPDWFRKNVTRYDDYDRQGPKVFAGEYAAQSVQTTSPENKNNWNCALSEAAFMTGLERNADVVWMTSYAPLMAHADAWQWTPDLIWFNNLESYGTANYYVQQLFSTNAGTELLNITENNQALTGLDSLYASAVKDSGTKELIIKVVNTAPAARNISVHLKGIQANVQVSEITLRSDDLEAVNSFEAPQLISPVERTLSLQKNRLVVDVPAQALVIYKIRMRQ